jgi:hypothetical protein
MPDPKRLLLYLIAFFAVYGLGVWVLSLPVTKATIHDFYRTSSTGVASLILKRAELKSQYADKSGPSAYDRFVVRISANEAEIEKRINEARRKGMTEISNPVCDIPFKAFEFYTVPLVFVLSLIAVTPMSIRRKIWSVGLGVLAMMLYLWTKFLIQILFSINVVYPIGMYELSGAGLSFVTFMSQAMTMGLSIMIGVVIWLIVSFKSLPLDRLKNILSS